MIPWGFILRVAAPFLLAGVIFAFGYSMGGSAKQRAWDLATARQVQAQLAASEQARETERIRQKQVSEAQHAREQERSRNDRIAADLRADRDRLRDDIARYAAGTDADTAAACRERAAAIGSLLDTALRAGEDCARAAETLAGDVRTLRSAWPVTVGEKLDN